MNLFHPADHDRLYGPPDLFDVRKLQEEHGIWGNQLLRAVVPLEFVAQIAQRDESVLLKGGTLLQNSLSWPPMRASVDLDVETPDPEGLLEVLGTVVDRFSRSQLTMQANPGPLPGFVAHVRFHRVNGPPWSLRVDALENDHKPSGTHTWRERPTPWASAPSPLVPPVEALAAGKILLAARPPYGRDVSRHLGRQNLIKDLFDLFCLGGQPLDGHRVARAAAEDAERKGRYLDDVFVLTDVLDEAMEQLRQFAHPRRGGSDQVGSLWRAYNRVRGGIRIPFTRESLRVAAGCSHHCLEGIRRDALDWDDAWRPAVHRTPRQAWMGKTIRPVLEVEDDYGPVPGPLEAWADFEP